MVRQRSGNCTLPPLAVSTGVRGRPAHTNTDHLCLFLPHHRHRCRESTHSTTPSANTACSWHRLRLPIAPRPRSIPCPSPRTPEQLPASAGPHESCSVLVLVAKTSSSPRCCVRGGKIRLQPPAQMCPGTKFTAGLAPDSAVVFGGTGKSLLSTTYYKHLPCCSFFSRETELSLATSDVGPVPVGAPSHAPPE